MPESHRTFLALSVPDAVRRFSGQLRDSLCDYGIVGKWVAPENLHVTTLFLGNQTEHAIETIRTVASDIAEQTPRFEFECIGIGSFKATPALLYLGLAPNPPRAFTELTLHLRERLTAAKVRLPLSVMGQQPIPHLTLVRFRHPGEARRMRRIGLFRNAMWHWSKPIPEVPNTLFDVDCIHLMKSRTSHVGPAYERLASFPLIPEA